MAKWAHSDTLDGGLTSIKTNAVRMILLGAYTAGDSYATVLGNALCTITMASTDYTLSSSGSNRLVTTGTKSGTASASGTANSIGFTDGSAKVLWVTSESSGQAVTSGNTVNFPALTYTSTQPT